MAKRRQLLSKMPTARGDVPVRRFGEMAPKSPHRIGEVPERGRQSGDSAACRTKLGTEGIKDAPLQADAGKLEDYVLRLFRQVVPDLAEESIILDRTHRAGRPSITPDMPQDTLTCFHSYRQKNCIMSAIRDRASIPFVGAKLSIFQDLSPITQQRPRTIRPATAFLHEQGVWYRLVEDFYSTGSQTLAAEARNQKRHRRNRKKLSRKSKVSDSIKERTALLNQLRQQGSASKTEND
ncbi:hypothetical protein NDU88_002970 [Pleurodeles waltl]|uniref:Uncharacterized protein n=1 Tax=Pleurodeles waltl TaxID=8319 RepID=A0AAV7T4W5_PLEWA|nr:hypothetical protein NDU88_002969 [Pleurodeles waltl]KAJ1171099.1 hypothetical protein NDU88_002970 [Pleurodeles waltl]